MAWNLKKTGLSNSKVNQELAIIRSEIVAAQRWIKEESGWGWRRRRQTPLYLVLGPERFGKTTLLAQSGMQPMHEQSLDGEMAPTKYCSFWRGEHAVYLDTAGNYTRPDHREWYQELIWSGLIRLLRRYWGRGAIAGVVVVIDLPAIMGNPDILKETLFGVRERIYEANALLGAVEIRVILTKCDRLWGFKEFFARLGAEELAQPFGLDFGKQVKVDLNQEFRSQFAQLLRQLDARLLENIRGAVSDDERSQIIGFPLGIAQLQPLLVEIINRIPSGNRLSLRGIYFTSSIQAGVPLNPLPPDLMKSLGLNECPLRDAELRAQQSYFVKELLVNHRVQSPIKQLSWRRLAGSLPSGCVKKLTAERRSLRWSGWWAIGMVVASGIIAYGSYQENLRIFKQLRPAMLAVQPGRHPNYLLLQQWQKELGSWWLKLGVNRVGSLYQRTFRDYQGWLMQDFTKRVEKHLGEIETAEVWDGLQLYRGLRAYLMLTASAAPQSEILTQHIRNRRVGHVRVDRLRTKNINRSYLEAWLTESANWLYPNEEELRLQVAQLLRRNWVGNKLTPEVGLVTRLSERLRSLPNWKQCYLAFESEHWIGSKEQAKSVIMPIATIYLGKNFSRCYQQVIPGELSQFTARDPILGELNWHGAEEELKAFRNEYLQNYLAEWQKLIDRQPPQSTDLSVLANYLNEIAAESSPLVGSLQELTANLTIEDAPQEFSELLTTILGEVNGEQLNDLRRDLQLAANYLQSIILAQGGSGKAAWLAVKNQQSGQILDNPIYNLSGWAKKSPSWLANYLNSLVQIIWQALFENAYYYIQQEWANQVVPFYQAKLADRYPLLKSGTTEAALEDFNRFFAPYGILDQFFNQYLGSLVEISPTDWQWKKLAGIKVTAPDELLEIMLRAALIQKMFYPNKGVTPTVNFTLTPLDMTPHTQRFVLQLAGDRLEFAHAVRKTQHITWSGNHSEGVSFGFTDGMGRHSTVTETGRWGWFRILDRANLMALADTRKFEVTFDLNGNAVRYLLVTPLAVNPFVPDIISGFHCQLNDYVKK